MPIYTRATQHAITGTGFWVRRDALGFTQSTVTEGSLITQGTIIYSIQAVRPHQIGDAPILNEVDLTKLPYEAPA